MRRLERWWRVNRRSVVYVLTLWATMWILAVGLGHLVDWSALSKGEQFVVGLGLGVASVVTAWLVSDRVPPRQGVWHR